ncbi:MAG: bifunctional mannosyl-3-phosphoglycerate synthase/mannosyl-3 phosphoglycerate phosphatase [Dehalococcoidia bacterium]|nr:MAG: bifunctional mannosyl-3-phosphoglycerate synthase/mannosyl-3 phosphoglycerate phosphatase [Dehalococcoidia bacterium]
MRIEGTSLVEHLGSVKISGIQRILELDSEANIATHIDEGLEIRNVGIDAMEDVQQRMAIVLPIKDEELKVFAGVLKGIPHNCLMIVVSNSERGETDAFRSERDVLSAFCRATKRQAVIVHQKDQAIAKALEQANYAELLDDNGFIRSGKSEGMLLGILLARLYGKDYVGFIDTDNYIPGAVWEYIKDFAIGFNLAKSPYAMVRILWQYKPKIERELYFKKWGRVSEITNRHINDFISAMGKFESDIIKTANAGEHAMSLDLAEKLTYATGYGIETQELISIIEQFGGSMPHRDKEVAEKGVEIVQIETINPHLHKEKGSEHLLKEMLLPSLSVIYHSRLCEESTRHTIIGQLVEQGCIKENGEVPKIVLLPPIQKIDKKKFINSLEEQLPIYSVPKGDMMPGQVIRIKREKTDEEPKKIVITDLEGTLFHPLTNSYTQALDAIRLLQENVIPIIFCSAKTRNEQQVYREELEIKDPFIVESGGAIFIPKDYFRLPFTYDKVVQDYLVIELGLPYQGMRQKLQRIQIETGISIKGFGDMSVEEVARQTAVNLRFAELMRQREYSEIIKIEGNKKEVQVVLNAMKESGLSYSQKFKLYEVKYGNSENKAVQVLVALYNLNFGDVFTLGIGNDESNAAMLTTVNLPILVQGKGNRWSKVKVKHINKIKGIGPEGWSRAIKELKLD